MTVHIQDTVHDQIQVLNDGTSVTDIMSALEWYRSHEEYKKEYNRRRREAYVPTGKPRGRVPAEKPPKEKRPRGRPRKIPPVENLD